MKSLATLEAIAVLVGIAIVAYLAYKLFGVGLKVGDAINSGANSAVKTLTGGAASGGEDSLGGVAARVREWVSGDTAKINAMKAGSNPSPFVGNVGIPSDLEGDPFANTLGGAATGMIRKP